MKPSPWTRVDREIARRRQQILRGLLRQPAAAPLDSAPIAVILPSASADPDNRPVRGRTADQSG
jgi:hypothetical protein